VRCHQRSLSELSVGAQRRGVGVERQDGEADLSDRLIDRPRAGDRRAIDEDSHLGDSTGFHDHSLNVCRNS